MNELANISLRAIAFIIMSITAVPKSYLEVKRVCGLMDIFPVLVFLLWLIVDIFMLSSIFFIYFGIKELELFDSLLLLSLSIVAALIYRRGTISKQMRELLGDEQEKTVD